MKKVSLILAAVIALCSLAVFTGCGSSSSYSGSSNNSYDSKDYGGYSKDYWDAARDAWDKYK
ncbi:MAG: hypothetical protein ACI4JD_07450 [Ruminococcus sp.]